MAKKKKKRSQEKLEKKGKIKKGGWNKKFESHHG